MIFSKDFGSHIEWPILGSYQESSNCFLVLLGITMATINDQILDQLRSSLSDLPTSVTHGIVIYRIVVGSPADAAGCIPGKCFWW